MKVILDTNIFISALIFKGVTATILELWKQDKFSLVFSRQTYAELIEKIYQFGPQIHATEELLQYAEILESQAIFVIPRVVYMGCEDPDDNMFIEAAFESQADYIVSGDKKVLKLQKVEGIPIVTATQFLSKVS